VRAGGFVGGDETDGLGAELAGLIVLHPEVPDAASLIALVDDLSPATLAGAIVRLRPGDVSGADCAAIVERARDGDPRALEQVETLRGMPIDAKTLALMAVVLRDPVATAARLRLALRAWLEPYRSVEERVSRAITRDVAARRAEQEVAPSDAVERATGGIRLVADASVRRVVLAPSYFARPYNYVFSGDDWRLFCYPVSEDAVEERDVLAPPAATVMLYHALSDRSRLRVLRLLATRDMYLTEIAQQLELSKPTVSHHMAQLRAAGLVTFTEEAGLTYYSLRRDRLEQVGSDLKRYLS
jgi:DNA-binding transcriptional ArsR family regulator